MPPTAPALLDEWRGWCCAAPASSSARGRLCMAVIDADRLSALQHEHGYQRVSLHKMPPGCTPKDHVLCAHCPAPAP